MDLKECREKIDRIDDRLVELLEERMQVVEEVAVNKAMTGSPVLDSGREEQKLADALGRSNPKFAESNREIFKAIMEASRHYQQDHRVEHGLLGQHLGHSISPAIHQRLGGYDYGLFQVEPEDLEQFFQQASFKGINVTIPYKKEAMKYCESLSETAKKVGSVNTILRNEDGTLTGYNTDYFGFKRLLDHVLTELGEGAGDSNGKPDSEELDRVHDKVIILGNGGASLAVQRVLAHEGFGNVMVISRNREDVFGEFITYDTYENIKSHLDAKMIINATPVGMYPENGEWLFEEGLEGFSQCKAVIDLIYNPINTKLVLEAKRLGMAACGGLEMLLAQALKTIEIFTGKQFTPAEEKMALDQLEKEYMNIVLIGMPGSGKTTVGKRVAELTGRDFIDLDDEVYFKAGQTPEEMILVQGEETFRKTETQVLREISKGHGQVIATGGGVVTREENRQLLQQNSVIVYLERDIEDLETCGRPLSQYRGVEELFKEREALYQDWSNFTVASEDESMAGDAIANLFGE